MFKQFKSEAFWNLFLKAWIILAWIGIIMDVAFTAWLPPTGKLGRAPLEMVIMWSTITVIWYFWRRKIQRKQHRV